MIYTIYTASGQITKVVECENIADQLAPDESYIEGEYLDNQYYVENGAPVELPEKPNEHCEFDYNTKQWFDTRTVETQWRVIRAERKLRLTATDWTQLPDVPEATRLKWQVYRQALRDITNQPDPFTIVFPTMPE